MHVASLLGELRGNTANTHRAPIKHPVFDIGVRGSKVLAQLQSGARAVLSWFSMDSSSASLVQLGARRVPGRVPFGVTIDVARWKDRMLQALDSW